MVTRPDVLVLGAGGVLGEAWMNGLLAGLEDATGFDLRQCEYFLGTSAGSIVATRLAAGTSPERPPDPGDTGNGPPPDLGPPDPAAPQAAGGLSAVGGAMARRAGAWAMAAGVPFAPAALSLGAPGAALMRAGVLALMPRARESLDVLGERIRDSGVTFDGRLRVAALDRASGRRVVFGSPRAPRATVEEAVRASCSVPWIFAPVRIGGREYVDGGAWSPTNLDAAPAGRDTQVLCLNPTGSLPGTDRATAVIRAISRSAVSVEALALRRRGALVETVAPNAESATGMGSDLMNRDRRERVLAAGYQQGLAAAGDA
jgi:NTE family protein